MYLRADAVVAGLRTRWCVEPRWLRHDYRVTTWYSTLGLSQLTREVESKRVNRQDNSWRKCSWPRSSRRSCPLKETGNWATVQLHLSRSLARSRPSRPTLSSSTTGLFRCVHLNPGIALLSLAQALSSDHPKALSKSDPGYACESLHKLLLKDPGSPRNTRRGPLYTGTTNLRDEKEKAERKRARSRRQAWIRVTRDVTLKYIYTYFLAVARPVSAMSSSEFREGSTTPAVDRRT